MNILELSLKPAPDPRSLTPAQLSFLGFRKASKKKGQTKDAPLPCLHIPIDPLFLIEMFLWAKVEKTREIGKPPTKSKRHLSGAASLEEIVDFLLGATYKRFVWIKDRRFFWDFKQGLEVYRKFRVKQSLSESEEILWF
jgi:hypothetical protein